MLIDPLSGVVASLKSVQLIPEVIPESFFPSVIFSVTYPTGKEVVLGNELTKEDTVDEPDVNFTPLVVPDAVSSTDVSLAGSPTYTLVLTDPDAPSREDPKFKEFRHWVITGLASPSSAALSDATVNINALKAKPSTTPYRPPGPRPASGIHRYTFLLFEEPFSDFSIPEGEPEYGATLEERRSWSAVKFGEKHGLKLVGATYFLVRSEE